MKKPSKPKRPTPAQIRAALANAGLEAKNIRKVVPPSVVTPSKAAVRKAKRQKETRKARAAPVPQKFKRALSKYGLGAAQPVIKKRGRYYTAAGLVKIQKYKLSPAKSVEVQNVYSWEPSDRKGWYIAVINGVPQKRMKRWKEIKREQGRAWDKEKIRAVAERTGLTLSKVRAIKSEIRREEAAKLRRFKKTKKYKRLSAAMKRRNTIHNRVAAVFGALCDILQVYGSPDTKPD